MLWQLAAVWTGIAACVAPCDVNHESCLRMNAQGLVSSRWKAAVLHDGPPPTSIFLASCHRRTAC